MAWVLTWCVQSLALAALAAGVTRLPLFRARAAARGLAWSGALAGIAVLPLLAAARLLTEPAALVAGHLSSAPAAGAEWFALELPPLPPWLPILAAAIWAVGALAWGMHLLASLVRLRALRRACMAVGPGDDPRLLRISTVARVRRSVRVALCDDLDGPAMLGYLDPIIALPRAQADRLTDEELDHVLLHELAHVTRRDDWFALAEHVVIALAWINPAVHWIGRQLAISREMACDDWVVARTASPVAYVRCLTRVAEFRRRQGDTRLAAAATGSSSALGRRVLRMLSDEYRPSTDLSPTVALVAPLAVGLLAIVVLQMTPVLVEATPDRLVARATSAPALGRTEAGNMAAIGVAPSGVGSALRQKRTLKSTRSGPAARPVNTAPTRVSATREVASGNEGPISDPQWGPLTDNTDQDSTTVPATLVPLMASAIQGLAAPAVTVASPPAMSESLPPSGASIWSRAAAAGVAVGEGMANASRASGSWFKRIGSSVSRPFAR
ncbi:MAG: M56 family metallopeptidase [Acidobacteriota bacterium]